MSNPDTQHILIEKQEQILNLQLNRPEKKNALTHSMYTDLVAGIQQAESDDNIRAILVSGSEECFTSGNDIQDFVNMPRDFFNSPVAQFLVAISSIKKPMIAAINGPAVGIGTTLLLHCDLAYVGPNTKFQMPFVSLGACPEAGSSLLLPKFIGHVKASELLLLSKKFSGQEALALGLVNEVCDSASDVLPRALAICQQIASQPPAAVRLTKALLKRGYQDSLKGTIMHEGEQFLERIQSPEAMEAFQAFLQKRQPDFSKFK